MQFFVLGHRNADLLLDAFDRLGPHGSCLILFGLVVLLLAADALELMHRFDELPLGFFGLRILLDTLSGEPPRVNLTDFPLLLGPIQHFFDLAVAFFPHGHFFADAFQLLGLRF